MSDSDSAVRRPRARSNGEPSRPGIMAGGYTLSTKSNRFRKLFREAVRRPPESIPKITSVRSVSLSNRPMKTTVGLTRYSDLKFLLVFSRPRQTITFYSSLFDALSDMAALAVIAHELAHAWLNEHVRPEESRNRELEADRLAREWGFGAELDALDREAETVNE
ncbi:MAG TPA: M48 family metalloprotease [Nitrososphaerales archaeon]|nr:M48 family metalloprotease [Nitrososphaerales archaeon]